MIDETRLHQRLREWQEQPATITSGPVRVRANERTCSFEIEPADGRLTAIAVVNSMSPGRREQDAEADAHLIAEAFNVHHETGLTPRQLAEKLKAICGLIPINYLQRHDAPGATGPTAALDIVSAMRDYAEDRWKLYELAKQRAELLEALEEITAAAWDTVDGSSPTNPIRKHLSNAEAAIAKARGGSA